MSTDRIRVDVLRGDGEATRLEGAAAIASVSTFGRDAPAEAVLDDPPTVAIRCHTKLQMAAILASILASAEAVAPGITSHALALARHLDAHNPDMRHALPPDSEGGDDG